MRKGDWIFIFVIEYDSGKIYIKENAGKCSRVHAQSTESLSGPAEHGLNIYGYGSGSGERTTNWRSMSMYAGTLMCASSTTRL